MTVSNVFLARVRCGLLLAVLVLLAGCIQEMTNQPRVETYESSRFFQDNQGARLVPTGTIARGQLPEDPVLATGKSDGQPVEKIPVPIDARLLERGRERFEIFCDHCHGPAGYGDGTVVQRGFPRPPSYHIDRLRNVGDGHIFDVVTSGFGQMPSFSGRIAPEDRWAIVAYVRALQLSQHAPLDELPEDDREQLQRLRPSASLTSTAATPGISDDSEASNRAN